MARRKKIKLLKGEPRSVYKDGRVKLKHPIPKCGSCKSLTVAAIVNYTYDGERHYEEVGRYCIGCGYLWGKKEITQHVY